MLKLFIGSHGAVASGMLSGAEVLLGKQSSITTYDAYVDDSTLAEAVETFFGSVAPGDQVVLVSDLYGGSVNSALSAYLERSDTVLISGANLGLVLALALEPPPIPEARIKELIQQARDQLRLVDLDDTAAPQASDASFFDD